MYYYYTNKKYSHVPTWERANFTLHCDVIKSAQTPLEQVSPWRFWVNALVCCSLQFPSFLFMFTKDWSTDSDILIYTAGHYFRVIFIEWILLVLSYIKVLSSFDYRANLNICPYYRPLYLLFGPLVPVWSLCQKSVNTSPVLSKSIRNL